MNKLPVLALLCLCFLGGNASKAIPDNFDSDQFCAQHFENGKFEDTQNLDIPQPPEKFKLFLALSDDATSADADRDELEGNVYITYKFAKEIQQTLAQDGKWVNDSQIPQLPRRYLSQIRGITPHTTIQEILETLGLGLAEDYKAIDSQNYNWLVWCYKVTKESSSTS